MFLIKFNSVSIKLIKQSPALTYLRTYKTKRHQESKKGATMALPMITYSQKYCNSFLDYSDYEFIYNLLLNSAKTLNLQRKLIIYK